MDMSSLPSFYWTDSFTFVNIEVEEEEVTHHLQMLKQATEETEPKTITIITCHKEEEDNVVLSLLKVHFAVCSPDNR